MMLAKHAVVSGQWLFRWRSYLPLLLALLLVPAVWVYTSPTGSAYWDQVWELGCFAVALFGLAIRCFAVGYSREGTSGRNTHSQRADALNTDGLYSVVRNPLYIGNYFMMLGPCLFVHVWWVWVIYTLLFWLYYERIVMTEEDYLHKKFGADYERFADNTPAFFPRLSRWRKPQFPFSMRVVLSREYSGLLGMIVSFVIVDAATNWRLTNTLYVSQLWLIILASGLLLYLTLRTLRKTTRVFDA